MEPIELLIKNICDALQRISALLFVMTIFCSVVFANMYVERYSIDEEQLLQYYVFVDQIDKIIDGDFVWGSKYTPEGRDGAGIILSILLGLLVITWGSFELYFKNKKES